MTTQRKDGPHLAADRLWGGGMATAAVAVLVAFVGVLVARGLFGVDLLAPHRDGAFSSAALGPYLVLAGAGAIVATLVLQLLVGLTPRPLSFFSTIAGLVTAITALAPLTADAPLSSRVATSLINLFIGLTITTMLPRVAYESLREDVEETP